MTTKLLFAVMLMAPLALRAAEPDGAAEKKSAGPEASPAGTQDNLWLMPVASQTAPPKNTEPVREGMVGGQDTVRPAQAAPPEKQDVPRKRIQLQLRELLMLREAAQQAGGDITFTMETVGINKEDLILPVAKQGFFNLESQEEGKVIRISSKRDDPYLEQLKKEIAALEARKLVLLNDMKVLDEIVRQTRQDAPAPKPAVTKGSKDLVQHHVPDQSGVVQTGDNEITIFLRQDPE